MSNPISAATRARFGASIVALAPAVMLVGLFAHPYIATLPDEAAVAATATADTTRWGLVHLTVDQVSESRQLSLGTRYWSSESLSTVARIIRGDTLIELLANGKTAATAPSSPYDHVVSYLPWAQVILPQAGEDLFGDRFYLFVGLLLRGSPGGDAKVDLTLTDLARTDQGSDRWIRDGKKVSKFFA